MKKIATILSASILALSLFSCSNQINNNLQEEQVNALAAPKKNDYTPPKAVPVNAKSMSKDFALKIANALDLNKDGQVDAKEVPLLIGGMGEGFFYNYDDKSWGYTPAKAFTPSEIVNLLMADDATLSIKGSKISAANREKVFANVAKVLVTDSIAEGKPYAYSSDIGYFTGNKTVKIAKMDESLLIKNMKAQTEIVNGTGNGRPYETSNGSLVISRDYKLIDKQYKTRLYISDYRDYTAGLTGLFTSHTLKNPTIE